jgi:hypothetical protein
LNFLLKPIHYSWFIWACSWYFYVLHRLNIRYIFDIFYHTFYWFTKKEAYLWILFIWSQYWFFLFLAFQRYSDIIDEY